MNLHASGWMVAFALIGCTSDVKTVRETGETQVPETGTAPADETGSAPTDETGDPQAAGPTIWAGPKTTFTKANFADPTDPANQDAITDAVVLTRGERGSLINVVIEDSANGSSPSGTEWAVGTTEALDGLEFQPLKQAANNQMSNLPGTEMVLHLIDEDIYIDVAFLSWTSGSGSGGGFSYERATED